MQALVQAAAQHEAVEQKLRKLQGAEAVSSEATAMVNTTVLYVLHTLCPQLSNRTHIHTA